MNKPINYKYGWTKYRFPPNMIPHILKPLKKLDIVDPRGYITIHHEESDHKCNLSKPKNIRLSIKNSEKYSVILGDRKTYFIIEFNANRKPDIWKNCSTIIEDFHFHYKAYRDAFSGGRLGLLDIKAIERIDLLDRYVKNLVKMEELQNRDLKYCKKLLFGSKLFEEKIKFYISRGFYEGYGGKFYGRRPIADYWIFS